MIECKDHGKRGNAKGYALARYKGKTELVHRIVYCQEHGEDIENIRGMVIRHSCDNARCIEPSHLLIGTQADNVKDMIARSRQNYAPLIRLVGAENPNSKLNYETAKQIRVDYANGEMQKDLARKYAVSCTLISLVVNHKIWSGMLHEINAAIAPLSITSDALKALGFESVGNQGAAKLYRASDFQTICAAIVRHVQTAAIRQQQMRKAA